MANKVASEEGSKASRSLSAEDHVAFLIACIKSVDTFKPDFETVAKQLNIASKGAAAKRWERLLKSETVTGMYASKKRENDSANATPAKKRKTDPKNPKTPKTPKTPPGAPVTPDSNGSNSEKKQKSDEDRTDEETNGIKDEAESV